MQIDPFVLFGIKYEFSIDSKELESKYLELQKHYHPDRNDAKLLPVVDLSNAVMQQSPSEIKFQQKSIDLDDQFANIQAAYNILIDDYLRGNFLLNRMISEASLSLVPSQLNSTDLNMFFEISLSIDESNNVAELMLMTESMHLQRRKTVLELEKDFIDHNIAKISYNILLLKYLDNIMSSLNKRVESII